MSRDLHHLACPVVLVLGLAGHASAQTPATQLYGERYEVTLTGLEQAKTWAPPNWRLRPFQAAPDHDFIIVSFKAIDRQTGQEDSTLSFEGFELSDADGRTYKGLIEQTDYREAPIPVPSGVKLRTFRMSGKEFDISAMAIKPRGQ
jgi:hypothetical protein